MYPNQPDRHSSHKRICAAIYAHPRGPLKKHWLRRYGRRSRAVAAAEQRQRRQALCLRRCISFIGPKQSPNASCRATGRGISSRARTTVRRWARWSNARRVSWCCAGRRRVRRFHSAGEEAAGILARKPDLRPRPRDGVPCGLGRAAEHRQSGLPIRMRRGNAATTRTPTACCVRSCQGHRAVTRQPNATEQQCHGAQRAAAENPSDGIHPRNRWPRRWLFTYHVLHLILETKLYAGLPSLQLKRRKPIKPSPSSSSARIAMPYRLKIGIGATETPTTASSVLVMVQLPPIGTPIQSA